MVRLFVGSFLKEEEGKRVEQFCRTNIGRLGELTNTQIRFVAGTNLHLTWVFIGEVEDNKVAQIKKTLQNEVELLKKGSIPALMPPGMDKENYAARALGETINIDVDYDYIEAWPNMQSARVLVATPSTVPDEILKIGGALRRAMYNMGESDGNEPRNLLFRPHITLARFNAPGRLKDGKLIQAMSEMLPIRQRIESIDLIQSHTRQKSEPGQQTTKTTPTPVSPSHYEIIGTAF